MILGLKYVPDVGPMGGWRHVYIAMVQAQNERGIMARRIDMPEHFKKNLLSLPIFEWPLSDDEHTYLQICLRDCAQGLGLDSSYSLMPGDRCRDQCSDLELLANSIYPDYSGNPRL